MSARFADHDKTGYFLKAGKVCRFVIRNGIRYVNAGDIADDSSRASENKRRRGWLQKNGKGAAYQAKRNSAKLQATPLWADLNAIAEVYEKRQRKTEQTGVVHHVDHIIPLQGKTVCGLHVANNLRVVTRTVNLQRRRKYVPK